jgi:hypothetical protein
VEDLKHADTEVTKRDLKECRYVRSVRSLQSLEAFPLFSFTTQGHALSDVIQYGYSAIGLILNYTEEM